MAFCTGCGAPVGGQSFCSSCGSAVATGDETATGRPAGAWTNPQPIPPPPLPSLPVLQSQFPQLPQRRRRRNPWLITVALMVIVALGVGAFLVTRTLS